MARRLLLKVVADVVHFSSVFLFIFFLCGVCVCVLCCYVISFVLCEFCEKNKTKYETHRSDTESHNDVNENEGKHNFMIRLNSLLFKKQSKKPEATAHTDTETGKISHDDDDDNAAPSESTVIIEDEPQKKVKQKHGIAFLVFFFHKTKLISYQGMSTGLLLFNPFVLFSHILFGFFSALPLIVIPF